MKLKNSRECFSLRYYLHATQLIGFKHNFQKYVFIKIMAILLKFFVQRDMQGDPRFSSFSIFHTH